MTLTRAIEFEGHDYAVCHGTYRAHALRRDGCAITVLPPDHLLSTTSDGTYGHNPAYCVTTYDTVATLQHGTCWPHLGDTK